MPDKISRGGRPTSTGDDPDSAAVGPLVDVTGRPALPGDAIGDSQIDLVDFQSLQSFPASDAPSWPSKCPEPAAEQANKQDRR